MKTVIYIIGSLILLGGLGMWIANRKADKQTAKARWIKYFSYLIITGFVIASILFNLFKYVAILIVLAGYYELAVAIKNKRTNQLRFGILSFFVYSCIVTGFLCFAWTIDAEWGIFIYLQVMVFDAFCQIIGQLIGKRKLAPGISPAKTVEGFAGGSVLCILTAVLTSRLVHVSRGEAFMWSLGTIACSLSGDLLASWFKRRAEIKDFSNLLPGQGGVLDRFDSFLMTGAFYCVIGLILLQFVGIC